MADSYSVGYGKPPRSSRFKKGRSGNPKGRPKGTPNLKSALERLLKTEVTMREGDAARKVSALEALLLGLLSKGVKGHAPSARTLLELIESKFPELPADETKTALASEDNDLVERFLERKGLKPGAGKSGQKGSG